MNRVNCQVTFHITGILNPLRPKGFGEGGMESGGFKGVGKWD